MNGKSGIGSGDFSIHPDGRTLDQQIKENT